jgi:CHAD domain-containing protein
LSTEQFAARLFRELHQAIITHEAGALRGEVEAVHDMRVGIRRLRVALSNFAFCLPNDTQRNLDAHLKKLALALGAVRDLDVMVETLEAALLTRPKQDHQAIKNLISRFRARRRRQYRHLKNYLEKEEFARFKQQFISSEAESETEKAHGQAA